MGLKAYRNPGDSSLTFPEQGAGYGTQVNIKGNQLTFVGPTGTTYDLRISGQGLSGTYLRRNYKFDFNDCQKR